MEVVVTRAGDSCSVSITHVPQLPDSTKPCEFELVVVCVQISFEDEMTCRGWGLGFDVWVLCTQAGYATQTHQDGAHQHRVDEGALDPAVGHEGEEGRGGDAPHADHCQQPQRAVAGA